MAKQTFNPGNSDFTAGVIILLIGVVLLLKAVGFIFPSWFLSWPMLIMAIGLIILARHQFRNGFGLFLVVFGGFFLLKNHFGIPFSIKPYLLPAGLIFLGIYLILKRNRENRKINEVLFRNSPLTSKTETTSNSDSSTEPQIDPNTQTGDPEFLNAQALFTGIERRVFTKNFKGGKASAIFGGTEIDLSQADIQNEAVLNIEIAFGGIKLVVPPHWNVQVNMGTVFAAGVEDKRFYNPAGVDPSKVFKIYGSVVFGGLEIKSF